MVPSSDQQIQFLVNLQRLLDEGSFVASYKFALLMTLADLSVEVGDDSGSPLPLDLAQIAEKFVRYYWRQVAPYPASVETKVLRQNTGKQAAIVNTVLEARTVHGDSLRGFAKNKRPWRQVVRRVGAVVRQMPLWKLQTVGRERLDFLYANSGEGGSIELRPGVVFCFRKFHSLVSDLVRGAWVRYIRDQNYEALGDAADLHQFLFGCERGNLASIREVLLELQGPKCFYCNSPLGQASAHVDHFVAWARYPLDLGHNFVLADNRCNNKKKDRLPAHEHLIAWSKRNAVYGVQMDKAFDERGVVADLVASQRVVHWAYSQTEAVNGLTWLQGDEMVPLRDGWRDCL